MNILNVMRFLIFISILPSVILMFITYKKDKIEKEPVKILIALFLIGGASIIPIGIVERIGVWFWSNFKFLDDFLIKNFIKAFLVVALVEEGVKFLILKVGTWKNKNFNYTFDAIVYAVAVSLGFAAAENILYVFEFGIFAAIFRAFMAIPAHMTLGVIMGIYYARAKLYEKQFDYSKKRINVALSLLLPMLLHGLYDFCVFVGSGVFLLIFIVVLISIYIILFRGINKYSNEDSKIEIDIGSEEGNF